MNMTRTAAMLASEPRRARVPTHNLRLFGVVLLLREQTGVEELLEIHLRWNLARGLGLSPASPTTYW